MTRTIGVASAERLPPAAAEGEQDEARDAEEHEDDLDRPSRGVSST